MNTPILRLEITEMRRTLSTALSEYVVKMDADIQAAIARVCTVENVLAVLERTARETMDEIIKKEIEDFYRYGDGRTVLREAVQKHLKKPAR